MTHTVVFDLNGTLLDISALDPEFSKLFGDAAARKKWFKQLTELFLTANVIDEYRNFEKLSDVALKMVAEKRGIELSSGDRASIHKKSLELPPFPDVRPALEQLKAAGLRLVVFTNSTEKSAQARLKYAGLDGYFDSVLSADGIKCYKPARAAYTYAAQELDIDLKEIVMVAAHAWDIAGALKAGCNAAFIARPGKVLDPDGSKPEISGDDLREVAGEIVGKYG